MRLNKIKIKNFKGFQDQVLNFDNKSVVIFGVNGTGKSTILAAVNYCFWLYLNRLTPSQGIVYRSFDARTVRHGSSGLEVSCIVEIDKHSYEFYRSYEKKQYGKKAVSLYGKKNYEDFVDSFRKLYLTDDTNMPIFVYYGTNRSVLDIPLRIRQKHQFSKLIALEHALENRIDFRTFFEWYRNQEDIENEYIKELRTYDYQDKRLKCVRYAIETMLDNVSNLKVKRNPLRMVVKKGNIEISVDQLSDGEKCTLALFGDLARRIAIANPNMNNPLEGTGIVLIDEVELHMHPSWQRRVLNTLKKVFPNIQFIITTHSPQVLGEVCEDYVVLKLSITEEGRENIEEVSTYGKDSNWILKYDMDTPERALPVLDKFKEFYEALDQNNYDYAQKILNDLQKMIGEDPALTSMQIQLDMDLI